MNLTELLDKLEAIEKKATPGFWSNDDRYLNKWAVCAKGHNEKTGPFVLASMNSNFKEEAFANSELIAESRNALPTLIKMLRIAREALEFYGDNSIQTREVVTQYKDSPPWTGFAKETGDDRRKSDKGKLAQKALAELDKLAEGVK